MAVRKKVTPTNATAKKKKNKLNDINYLTAKNVVPKEENKNFELNLPTLEESKAQKNKYDKRYELSLPPLLISNDKLQKDGKVYRIPNRKATMVKLGPKKKRIEPERKVVYKLEHAGGLQSIDKLRDAAVEVELTEETTQSDKKKPTKKKYKWWFFRKWRKKKSNLKSRSGDTTTGSTTTTTTSSDADEVISSSKRKRNRNLKLCLPICLMILLMTIVTIVVLTFVILRKTEPVDEITSFGHSSETDKGNVRTTSSYSNTS